MPTNYIELATKMTNSNYISLTAAIIAAVSVLVAILTFIISNNTANKRAFISTFDAIYKKTFSLRTMIDSNKNIMNNNEFHYEIDTIINNKNIENIVLDYLTEIENLSMIVVRKNIIGYSKLFNKLASPELYKRLLCLFPYILYKQNKTNNYDLFSNYVNLISKIEKVKMHKKYKNETVRIYSGIRVSDIDYNTDYFSDSLCIFGKTKDASFSQYRANQNYNKSDFTDYYAEGFKKIDKKYGSNQYEIMLYNQQNAFELSTRLREKVVCCNDEKLLIVLNDKIATRQLLINNNIKTPTFVVLNGFNLNLQEIRKHINSSDFVIQKVHGGGGIGTFLFNENTFEENKNLFNNKDRYLISNYLPNSISVNVHIFVSENNNLVTPGSVQIIENISNQLMYRGADYVAYRDIPLDQREEIRKTSINISNILRNQGYLGVAGIDYIIDESGEIYCSEINPRFQASSIILSKYLYEKNQKHTSSNIFNRKFNLNNMVFEDTSIYEINKHAFDGIIKTGISYYDEINYSCYFYYNDENMAKVDIDEKLLLINENYDQYQNTINNSNKADIFVTDIGLDSYTEFSSKEINKKSYLFRVIFNNKIAQISYDHSLWLNDNIRIENAPENKLDMKIALINQGIQVPKSLKVKKAVFSGIDFYLENYKMHINSPMNIGLSFLSPFKIVKENSNNHLYYYSKKLSRIEIENDYFSQQDILAAKDIALKDIIYISTDRIRIKPINGCDFKSCGNGCRFCELKHSKNHYSISDIKAALDMSKKLNYDHILIGGGTDLSSNSWDNIVNITKLVKSVIPDKRITLMSIPAPSKYLKLLYDSGIEDIAFNIEIFDEERAAYYMPGKRNYNYQYYYESLKEAVEIFGKGNVRSAFIVGLESSKSLLNGIEELCKISVIPCLSVYRNMPNTISFLTPTNEFLKNIYIEAEKITNKYNLYIGPVCDNCKNNMLAL